ncbi:MAG: hypothetical protein E6J87_10160 [Deltaproteobacteria bacterium]|nr:MAG: hypothetical protein E6J87_10160 [Deltaproteobacteria bacterium]
MRAKLVTLALALAIGASSGCAWPDQRVRLQPTIPFARSELGGRRAMELRVTDQRPRGEIGRRIGPGVGGAITTDQDLELLVRNSFADALERNGFTVASSGTGEAVLDVALRNFEYEVARQGWSLSIRAWAALVPARAREQRGTAVRDVLGRRSPIARCSTA